MTRPKLRVDYRRALLAWCDQCHDRRLGHELERRLAPPAATWRSRVDRVRLAPFGGRIVHAGLNCLPAQHYRTSRISRQSNDRFWLRLSKKARHIGGVKQWNQGGTESDSFLPQVVTKRINLSVLSG